jgi:hypothetical protein
MSFYVRLNFCDWIFLNPIEHVWLQVSRIEEAENIPVNQITIPLLDAFSVMFSVQLQKSIADRHGDFIPVSELEWKNDDPALLLEYECLDSWLISHCLAQEEEVLAVLQRLCQDASESVQSTNGAEP